MTVSLLKTMGKELLRLVRNDNLLPNDIVQVLDLLVPPHLPPVLKQSSCVVGVDDPRCVLPLGTHSATGGYGLSGFGLQQQMVVHSNVSNTFLQNAAHKIFQQQKGVLFVDGAGDNSAWAKLYGYAQTSGDTQRLRVINFMMGGQTPPFTKLSHSVNVLSGLSRGQLKSWIELMAQAGAHTHPHLNLKPVKSNAAVFAEVFTHLSTSMNVFLTFSRMQQWGNIETFSQVFPKTTLGKVMAVDFSTWQPIFNAWNTYIAPFVEKWAHVLDQSKADMHLMQALRSKEIIITLLPAMECPIADVQLLGNAVAATFVQHMSETHHMEGVAFFNHGTQAVSANITQKIAKIRHSWGVVWGGDGAIEEQPHTIQFIMNAKPAELFDLGLPATHLNASEGYLVERHTHVKLTAFYTAPMQAQMLKLPATDILTPTDVTHHVDQKRVAILAQQMQQSSRSLAWCHETVARMYGYGSWHEAINAQR